MGSFSFILGIIIVLICAIFQLSYYFRTKSDIEIYKDIFVNDKDLVNLKLEKILNDDGLEVGVAISMNKQNAVYKNIQDSINNYLGSLKGNVIDFNIIKDIVERNSDALESEIDSHVSMPINIGLMGTMVGIVFGVLSLVMSGDLEALITQDSSEVSIDGVISLLTGVGIAMLTSIMGILLTTIQSDRVKSAKSETEYEKNNFLSWIQVHLLPEMSSDFSAIVDKMSKILSSFNNTFLANTKDLDETLRIVKDTTENQKELLSIIDKLNINEFATINVKVYDRLKNCSDEIGSLANMLAMSSQYVATVDKLNTKLNDTDERVRMIESMAKFFMEEEEHFKGVYTTFSKVDDTLKRIVEHFTESIKEQTDGLIIHTQSQNERYKRELDEQSNILKDNARELSEIFKELKQISEVKSAIIKFEDATKQQNRKIEELTNAIMKVIYIKTSEQSGNAGLSNVYLLPKSVKIIGWILLGVIFLTCLLSIFLNVVSSFNVIDLWLR